MEKDGWHKIGEYSRVYTEDGRVIRGVSYDLSGDSKTVYPYRTAKGGGWDNCSGVKYETFRKGYLEIYNLF